MPPSTSVNSSQHLIEPLATARHKTLCSGRSYKMGLPSCHPVSTSLLPSSHCTLYLAGSSEYQLLNIIIQTLEMSFNSTWGNIFNVFDRRNPRHAALHAKMVAAATSEHTILALKQLVSPLFDAEILAKVFAVCVAEAQGDDKDVLDTRGAPWVLAQVCKTWRKVALSSPELWCAIDITLDRHDEAQQSKRMGFLFGLLLRRSGKRALPVRSDLTTGLSSSLSGMHNLVDCCIEPHHDPSNGELALTDILLPRLRKLEISKGNLRPVAQATLLNAFNVPALEHLIVECCKADRQMQIVAPLIALVCRSSCSLQEFTFKTPNPINHKVVEFFWKTPKLAALSITGPLLRPGVAELLTRVSGSPSVPLPTLRILVLDAEFPSREVERMVKSRIDRNLYPESVCDLDDFFLCEVYLRKQSRMGDLDSLSDLTVTMLD
ncbi:hypothetical protein C8R47DRAFT_1136775 [Mycena vitilis]|nr:hypothetical protein C8R47DRAFT_1136775 [Mycena vitilis]